MSGATPGVSGPRGRGRRLIGPLRHVRRVALALAVAGALAPDGPASVATVALLGVLVGTPVARLAFLAQRWWRIGDRTFAVRAGALLVLVVAGAGAALAR